MDLRFHGLAAAPTDLTLSRDAHVTTDARQASRNFALDHLAVVLTDDVVVPAGARLRVAGSRSMARHGASALDTDITAYLMLGDGQDDVEIEPTLSRAMLMVNLGLATPEAPTVDPAWSDPLG